MAEAIMDPREQAFLSALVAMVDPLWSLEIGTFAGGSAQLILNAMSNQGKLWSIDPNPQVESNIADWHIITGRSPDCIAQAAEGCTGKFQFVLLDGDHSRQAVIDDLVGLIPHLAWGAFILCHDAAHWQVAEGIRQVLGTHLELQDCGCFLETAHYLEHLDECYYGMWLLQYRP